ncbi:MAG: glycosyltransferase [Pseudomonadota bacterium]|nr:glycosyltransferase [Pseudomonadota bacterium]
MSLPPVSIVIPTLNRESCLMDTLDDLLKQEHGGLEIVIVDQSEQVSDKVIKFIENHDKQNITLKYFLVNFKGLPRARNFGWQICSHEFIIFIDDDVKIPTDFVTKHCIELAAPRVALVAGGIDEAHRHENKNPTRTGKFNYWTATPHRDFNSKVRQEVLQAPGGNFSVKQGIIRRVGGFDEGLGIGAALYEETDFCLRVKRLEKVIIFSPDARLIHLAFSTGGCRVPEVPNYVWSLARNRTTIILRHLSWFHFFTAFVRLGLLIGSYTKSSRNLMTLLQGIRGIVEGVALAHSAVKLTPFSVTNVVMQKVSARFNKFAV